MARCLRCLAAGLATILCATLHGCGGGGPSPPSPLPTPLPPPPPPSPPGPPASWCPSPPVPSTLQAMVADYGAGPMAVARALGGWTQIALPDPASPHELVFVVKQRNMDKIYTLLMTRSNPKSPNYGEWLSPRKVRRLTRNDDALQAVRNTLKRIGATLINTTLGGEMVRARATIRTWEKLLNTRFHLYKSERVSMTHIAVESYEMPAHLVDHVSSVLGCLELPVGHAPRVRALDSEPLNPSTLRKAYNLPPVAADGSAEAKQRQNVSQAVFASLGQFWSPSDREHFQQMYNLPVRPVHELDGGRHSSDSECISNPDKCAEANLDVQYMLAMSPWSQMGLWYTDADFTAFLEALHNMKNPPEVISISYGGFEAQHSTAQINTFDTLGQKLGVMGVTLIASSGDDGAQGGLWRDRDQNCADTDRLGLQVNWPASSPYITAVGATAGIESGKTEVTCQVGCDGGVSNRQCLFSKRGPQITSGGGISGLIPRPDWQNGHNPCSKRGIPDVSLAGHSYNVIIGGMPYGVDGTSASAPAFGGIISLVNARRKSQGKSSVGFINPAIYQNTSGFFDITQGDNSCGGSGSAVRIGDEVIIPCCGGYNAQAGWDAATGLGSVNFPKFEAIFEGTGPPTPPVPPVPPVPPSPPSPPPPSGVHYERPPCKADETLLVTQGYQVCAPPCDDRLNGQCPTDVPSGTTARPNCGVLRDQQGNQYCGLICEGIFSNTCPSGAQCVTMGAAGVCLYPGTSVALDFKMMSQSPEVTV